jgi:prepilin-type N-terminal cleavage/methylation domain-containing protein
LKGRLPSVDACRGKGFTLIELMIVVVILGTLAAITLPKMVVGAQQAQEAVLQNNLSTIRAQVQLYTIQHGMYPGCLRADGQVSSWSGTLFVNQLIASTDTDGNVTGNNYGPYMAKFPVNAFAEVPSSGAVVIAGAPTGAGGGWAFDPNTGEFHCNDPHADHQAW